MKVYVITKGSYSDYRICAVALDKDKAEILRKALSGWEEAEIETYETDQFITEIEAGLKIYQCVVNDNGLSAYERDYDYADDICFNKVNKTNRRIATYSVYVWAKDEDSALKIAADKIAEYEAKEAGI
jgi:hypothetical protein